MSFHITKTESVVPFLWIILKTVVVVALFGFFSTDVRNWKTGQPEGGDGKASRSDVTQKVTRKTLTGLNTHIITDNFVGFCLLHSVEARNYVCTQRYWLLTTSCLWSILGLLVFVYETLLKCKVLRQKASRDRCTRQYNRIVASCKTHPVVRWHGFLDVCQRHLVVPTSGLHRDAIHTSNSVFDYCCILLSKLTTIVPSFWLSFKISSSQ